MYTSNTSANPSFKVDSYCATDAEDMRTSSIMTFEPGLEHGVPWGRDLFTFVTSAAGHMMRTLQRPRKNKPSKRQVNHRRFLHNMIHRKFAEIEAANHQLASALFSTDKSQSQTAKPSVTDDIPDQQSQNAPDTSLKKDITKPPIEHPGDVCDLWTLDPSMETQVTDRGLLNWKPLNSKGTHPKTEKTEKNRNLMKINPGSLIEKDTDFSFEKQQASTELESLTNILLEDSVSTWIGSIERMRMNPKPFNTKYSEVKPQHKGNDMQALSPPSPVMSLLSLDSCDLEIQMLIDAEHTGYAQDSLQMDTTESFNQLYFSDHQDGQIYDPKMTEWVLHDDENQSCMLNYNTHPSCLDSLYGIDNRTCSGSGFNQEEFEYDLQTHPMSGNANLNWDQKGQKLNVDVVGGQESQSRLYHDQVNYYTSQTNIPEDHFRQIAPYMMTNSISNQMVSDCIDSSHNLDHHIFPELESQIDCQSKRINNWEQEPRKNTNKNYSRSLETYQHLMVQDTNMKNTDKNPTQNMTESGHHDLDGSCFEGFYDKGESCSYPEFQGNQKSHNFEGVARSFPATVQKIHPPPIPTPPLDDDWLFSNIVSEVKSMTTDY